MADSYTAAEKYPAKGAKLLVGDGADNWVQIPSFRDGSQSGGEAEKIDVTTHDTVGNSREFRNGFDGETGYDFEILYDPASPAHQLLAQLKASGDVVPWRIVLVDVDASEITFDGSVTRFPIPAVPIADAMTMSVGLTISNIEFPGMGS